MKCFLYNFNDENYKEKLKKFINENCIIQQDYLVRLIYENHKNFNYHYVICEKDEKIKGVMPFILYKHKLGNIINSMPFIGYGGIACIKNEKYKVFSSINKFLDKFCIEKDVKLATICTPPFKTEEYNLYHEIFKPNFEKKNFYQYLNLKEDVFQNMKSKFRGNLRRNIKKCERYGVRLEENYSKKYLRYWYDKIYLKRLTETNCSIYPFSVFETLVKFSQINKVKMIYAILQDKIIGAGLYINQGDSVDNFMRVVESEYFYTQAGNYLDYYSVKYAIQIGAKYYNWQSCDEIGSPIYKYKDDWGSKIDYHWYLTKIVGDISALKNSSLEYIKNQYKGIYVMPYEEFNCENQY